MDASDSDRSPVRAARGHRGAYLLLFLLVALLLIYTLAGFLLVPALARRALTRYVRDLPGIQLRVGALAFNPFTLHARLSAFELRGAGDVPLLGFQALDVAISPTTLWQRGYVLRSIELQAPMLDASISRDGQLNLLALRPPATAASTVGPAAAHASAAQGMPPVSIGQLRITDGSVRFEDHSRATPFVTTLTPINFSLSHFRTEGGSDGRFQLAARAASGESLDLSGALSMQPLASSGEFSLQALQASTLRAYLGDALPVALRAGEGGLAGSYRFVGAGVDTLSVQLSQARITGLAVAVRADPTAMPWLSIPDLTLSNVSIELPQRQVSVGVLAIGQLHLSAWIEPDGTLSLQQVLGSAPPSAPPRQSGVNTPAGAAGSAGVPAAAAAPTWTLSLARLTLQGARLSLADRSVSPAVTMEVAPLQLTATGYSTAGHQPVVFQVATGIGTQGHLASQGSLLLSPLSGTVSVNLQHLDLTVLQPYIARRTSITLYRGNLGMQGNVTLGARIAANGELTLQDFATRGLQSNTDFISGHLVQLAQVRYQQSPAGLDIGKVRAQGLYGRVAIGADGQLNLTSLLSPPTAKGVGRASALGAASAPRSASTAAVPAAAPTNTGMPIRVDRIELQGSTANFADRSVQPNFAAAIEGLHGTILGLSSDPGSRAKVQLAGAVNRYAPVTIDGQVNVLSAQTYTDLSMNFENIDLPLFNPYSGKFAGYSIAQGKLTTQMHYHVENRQLNATHHVVIDQLEFGPATDTKPAVPLPIRLAAALLKDRHGVITLDLPVSGSLNDPSFRIAPIVWKVFTGLLRHIVTAPFAWLGSLLGGDGARLAYVDFAPGSAALSDSEAHKLAQLAQALEQRPQLHLDVPLHTLSEADDGALEHTLLEQAVATLTAPGAPDSQTPAPGKTGKKTRQAPPQPSAAQQAVSAALPPKRFLALATLYRRRFRAAPFFPTDATTLDQRASWLEQQLLPSYAPPRQQRDALAIARATAAQMAVLAGGKVAATRVFLTQRASGGGPTGVVRMDLQLQ